MDLLSRTNALPRQRLLFPAEKIGLGYWLIIFIALLPKISDPSTDAITRWGALILHSIPLFLLFAFALVFRATEKRSHLLTRAWLPSLMLPLYYFEVALIIAWTRNGIAYDPLIAKIDQQIFGAQLALDLERFYFPSLAFALEIVYVCFLPLQVLVAALLLTSPSAEASSLSRRLSHIQLSSPVMNQKVIRNHFASFTLNIAFLLSYLGYLACPVRGPQFYFASRFTADIAQLPAHQFLRNTLLKLQGPHWDCFPSGHVLITALTLWLAHHFFRKHLLWLWPFFIALVIATVYLRYHYVVDLAAGLFLAMLVIWLSVPVFQILWPRSATKQ